MARRSTEESLQETLDRLARQDELTGATSADVPIAAVGSPSARATTSGSGGAIGQVPPRRGARRARAILPVVALVVATLLVSWLRTAVRTVGDAGAQAPPTSEPAASAPSTTASPSSTPSPVPTFAAPRSSPSSSADVASRSPGVALPAATARSLLDAAFGTFRPYTRSGSGPAVVALPVHAAGVVVITVRDEWIVASFRDATDAPTDDSPEFVVAGTTTVPFNLVHDDVPAVDARSIVVSASVPWTILVEPVSAAPVITRSAHGSREAVLVSYGGATDFTVTCPEGTWITSISTRHDQVDEADMYVDRLTFRARWAPQVLVLSPDGRWTLTAT